MDTPVLIAIIVVVVLILAGAGFLLSRQRSKSQALQDRFGPEYERTVQQRGDRRAAEDELTAREERREEFDIRPLDPVRRDQYVSEWRAVQSRFVDEPGAAVRDAHGLVTSVMSERGYPVDDFEQRAADLSVDHPQVVEDYRAAYHVSEANEQGRASTEELRDAIVRYRSLFTELLDIDDNQPRTDDSADGSTR